MIAVRIEASVISRSRNGEHRQNSCSRNRGVTLRCRRYSSVPGMQCPRPLTAVVERRMTGR